MAKKVSLLSLGCFRNDYDSGVVAARLAGAQSNLISFEKINNKNKCNILAVNTCGFIDLAKIESIQAINQAIELKKEKKVKQIYVFGCLVQRFKKQLEKHFPEVDRWWGKEDFPKNYQKRLLNFNPSGVGFLKVCEGCLNLCSYCAIPQIKGPLVSRPAAQILKEVEELENLGLRELNIIGQDITSWGKDLKVKQGLEGLLKKILKKTKKIKWIRLIYTHPRHFSDSLINLIANEKRICKYVDLPIQHINKRILKAMNRQVTPQQIVSLLEKIREKIPQVVLRTSVITGFPGETEAEFQELLEFIKKTKFERLGAFVYSREEGTKAAGFEGQIHHMVKKRRHRQIMEAQQKISSQILENFIGKEIEVLVLGKKEGFYWGRSQFDAPQVDGEVIINKKNLKIGSFYRLKVTQSREYDLIAA